MQCDKPYIRQWLIFIWDGDIRIEIIISKYHKGNIQVTYILLFYLRVLDGLNLRGKGLSCIKWFCYIFPHIPNILTIFIQS